MKAIQINQAGGSDQLQLHELAKPEIKSNEILVQVKAAGLNFIDIYTRTGLYKPSQYPYTPGKEGSGIVVAVGNEVRDIKLNDRVAFCSPGSGTYAEYVAIPSSQVVLIPDPISFEVAAAAMLQGLTAYYLSHETILLNHQHTALIHAGAGGVGLLLIQMAKLLGAKVISTVSTDDKAMLAKKAGADHVIVYTRESFLNSVMTLTQERGVNVVYDAVGKTTFDDSLKSLAIRGMMVTYGQASGPIPAFELSKLAGKSLFITRPNLANYTNTNEELNAMSTKLFDLILNKKLEITIGQRYPLVDAAKAQEDLESRKTIGKSLLIIDN